MTLRAPVTQLLAHPAHTSLYTEPVCASGASLMSVSGAVHAPLAWHWPPARHLNSRSISPGPAALGPSSSGTFGQRSSVQKAS